MTMLYEGDLRSSGGKTEASKARGRTDEAERTASGSQRLLQADSLTNSSTVDYYYRCECLVLTQFLILLATIVISLTPLVNYLDRQYCSYWKIACFHPGRYDTGNWYLYTETLNRYRSRVFDRVYR